jgi:HAD superfamily hydrolase (TIGR01549 family)
MPQCEAVLFDIGETLCIAPDKKRLRLEVPDVIWQALCNTGSVSGQADKASFVSAWWEAKERHRALKKETNKEPSLVDLILEVATACHLSVATDPCRAAAACVGDHMANAAMPTPGGLSLVEALRSQSDVKVGILSNCNDSAKQVQILNACGYDLEMFDAVILSSDVGVSKPAPEIFKMALQELRVDDPARAVMVGDKLSSDVFGAKMAGMKAIFFPTFAVADAARENKELASQPDHLPDAEVTDLGDLPRVISELYRSESTLHELSVVVPH